MKVKVCTTWTGFFSWVNQNCLFPTFLESQENVRRLAKMAGARRRLVANLGECRQLWKRLALIKLFVAGSVETVQVKLWVEFLWNWRKGRKCFSKKFLVEWFNYFKVQVRPNWGISRLKHVSFPKKEKWRQRKQFGASWPWVLFNWSVGQIAKFQPNVFLFFQMIWRWKRNEFVDDVGWPWN